MRTVTENELISIDELRHMAAARSWPLVTAVVDISRSMINLRFSFGNSSRGVDGPSIRERITALVDRLVIG